jgi:RND superfamily putative drug exporter
MRRPLLVAAATTALMLALAAPALGLRWSGVDATSLPSGQSARTVFEEMEREFPEAGSSPVLIAARAPEFDGREVAAYAATLQGVGGGTTVSGPRRLGGGLWEIELSSPAAPSSPAGQELVSRVRAFPAPFPVAVGGAGAELLDSRSAVSSALPLALAILVVLTLAALWLMTASAILPVKALAMNFLTLAAATGIAVFVFQDGNLDGLIGADRQTGIEQTDYLVLAAIVFGLSTDYGVFLLSRIKEERDRGASDADAIPGGLQRTGAVVSAAAILLAVALGAFVTSGVVFLKELGVGAACAVLLDAFVVRALLVPSLMTLLGEWNWWQPRPLRWLHARIGIAQGGSPPARLSSSP